jgi:hypothetical protein
MKCIRLVGLCVVAVLALSAMTAVAASAAPDYGQCKALTKNTTPKAKHGKFSDGTCSKLFEKKEKVVAKGSFEWYPGPPANCYPLKKGEYTDAGCTSKSLKAHKGNFEKSSCSPNCAKLKTSGGEAFLENEAGTIRIKCATNSSEGAEILSPTLAGGKAKYTGCHSELIGVATCESAGAAAEEIKTEPLEASPVVEGGTTYVHYTSSAEAEGGKVKHVLAVFKCGSVGEFRVWGFANGKVKGGVNEMAITDEQEFSKAIGHQSIELEVKTGVGTFKAPEQSKQNQTTKFTSESPLGSEINTAF